MFQGRWPNPLSLDDKNRLTLPARLRDGEKDADGNQELMAGVFREKCIYVHSAAQHQDFLDQLFSAFGDDQRGRRAKTYVLSRFVPVRCDAQGRITLTPALLQTAGLERATEGSREDRATVILVAQDARLEVWESAEFKRLEAEVEADDEIAASIEAALGQTRTKTNATGIRSSNPGEGKVPG